jgi:protein KRI1
MSSNDKDLNTLKINEDYAKKFHHLKKIQILEKTKQKYGKNFEDMNVSESSSEDESEDSQAILINDKVMEKFIDVFNKISDANEAKELLNSKDPIFNDDDFKTNKSGHEKASYTVKDALLNYKEDGEDDDIYNINYQAKGKAKSNKEKQDFLKKAEEEEEGADDDNKSNASDYLDDGFLKIKVKETDEEEVYDSHQPTGDIINNTERNLEDLGLDEILKNKKLPIKNDELIKKFWGEESNKKLDKDERFLRNYILSQAWLENNENLVSKRLLLIDREDDAKDEVFEEFEAKYNFRYEEEGGANITTHKRDLETYRLKDDTRVQKRKEKEHRKEEEKKKIISELDMAKQIKKSEIKEKLEKIEKVAGTDKIKEIADALEGEFDMDKFDSLMNKVFDKEYYDEKESEEDIKEVIKDKEVTKEFGDDDDAEEDLIEDVKEEGNNDAQYDYYDDGEQEGMDDDEVDSAGIDIFIFR